MHDTSNQTDFLKNNKNNIRVVVISFTGPATKIDLRIVPINKKIMTKKKIAVNLPKMLLISSYHNNPGDNGK